MAWLLTLKSNGLQLHMQPLQHAKHAHAAIAGACAQSEATQDNAHTHTHTWEHSCILHVTHITHGSTNATRKNYLNLLTLWFGPARIAKNRVIGP